jgi:hypothetical protein
MKDCSVFKGVYLKVRYAVPLHAMEAFGGEEV